MHRIFTHQAYNQAPPVIVANALATDFLRKMNVDERPKFLEKIREWRPEVYQIILKDFPQHC